MFKFFTETYIIAMMMAGVTGVSQELTADAGSGAFWTCFVVLGVVAYGCFYLYRDTDV